MERVGREYVGRAREMARSVAQMRRVMADPYVVEVLDEVNQTLNEIAAYIDRAPRESVAGLF